MTATVTSQDELRKKLAKRGFNVTQATLSRDMRELNLYKGPNGYTLANAAAAEDDRSPEIDDLLRSFGLEVRQAMNQVVIITTTGGAQPVAAGLDYEVNLKAELEIMELHKKLEHIRSQHLEELLRSQYEQLRLLTLPAA